MIQPAASHFIHGEYVEDDQGTPFETINPATGLVNAQLHEATPAILERAVASAQAGQRDWIAFTSAQRKDVLHKVAARLTELNAELAMLETTDTGKPISETLVADPASAAECFEYYSRLDPLGAGERTVTEQGYIDVLHEPLGVCAGIGAWNYPIQIAGWKAAPALACGNAMIFKPSEVTPLSALKLAEIILEAGAPKGLFNVIQGSGAVGQFLASDKRIAKVSLTGSLPTGRKILAAAVDTLKHVTLELGGKSPIIVFADADLDLAVDGAIAGNFYSSGQICSNGTRIFVQHEIHKAFMEKFVAASAALKMGDPTDTATDIGPLVTAEHRDKVLGYIRAGSEEGAKLVLGGNQFEVSSVDSANCFVEPTIFAEVTDDMRIAREEIFGPVASVLTFDTEEEVIARANATEYGLAAGVYTASMDRAHRVVAQLEAGTCWVNTYNEYPIEMSFGGYKMSGLGRENGSLVLDHYRQSKSVLVNLLS